ncbi:very short patch repair endonuclease [Brevundimonas sp. M20]|uniref:very short patch repair endonuclease n=1 Tax=Brevundimonas sp. M20 TaxID=2591463 RepID=UPI001146E56E|nr:very short patch repair endonuclease [Brevundimonas sp. M20]QDH74406.1 DNA mismatch endonuclease Vsr [Brevundimonas sp. M20]
MTDVFTPEKRSAVMRRVKGKDTSPELAVRRILRTAGIGYRLGGAGLPGRPDIVMKGRRTVVLVHGCFWHGHDCPRGARQPKANANYWVAKIDRNRARDLTNAQALQAAGWRVVTVWECAMKASDFPDRLLTAVRGQATAVSMSSTPV